MRPILDVSHQREEPLPLEGKLELRDDRAPEAIGKGVRVAFFTLKRDHRPTPRERQLASGVTPRELALFDDRNQRQRRPQRVCGFSDIPCDHYPMPEGYECLRNSLEQRRAGSNNQDQCHYKLPTLPPEARPAISVKAGAGLRSEESR